MASQANTAASAGAGPRSPVRQHPATRTGAGPWCGWPTCRRRPPRPRRWPRRPTDPPTLRASSLTRARGARRPGGTSRGAGPGASATVVSATVVSATVASASARSPGKGAGVEVVGPRHGVGHGGGHQGARRRPPARPWPTVRCGCRSSASAGGWRGARGGCRHPSTGSPGCPRGS